MDETGGYQQNKFVAEFYDFVPDHDLSWDAEFYIRLSQESEGPVLELACGTGRLIIPIARAGVEITGLELSEEMLAVARQKLSNEPRDVQDRVRLVHGDMRKFQLGQRYGLIMIPIPARPGRRLLLADIASVEPGFGWGFTARAMAHGRPCHWWPASKMRLPETMWDKGAVNE